MRVFGPVAEPTPTLLTPRDADGFDRSAICAKPVRHDAAWPAVALHRPFQKLKRSPAIEALGGEHLEHLALVINSPPEIVRPAIDPNEHLVQVPTPARIRLVLNAPLADRCGKQRAEPVPPEPYRFVADIDPPLE